MFLHTWLLHFKHFAIYKRLIIHFVNSISSIFVVGVIYESIVFLYINRLNLSEFFKSFSKIIFSSFTLNGSNVNLSIGLWVSISVVEVISFSRVPLAVRSTSWAPIYRSAIPRSSWRIVSSFSAILRRSSVEPFRVTTKVRFIALIVTILRRLIAVVINLLVFGVLIVIIDGVFLRVFLLVSITVLKWECFHSK